MLLALAFSAALAAKPAPAPAPPAQAEDWEATLDKAIPSIVVIRMSVPRSFDTESAGNMVATGFVVDAEKGIIVTNRHVVTPGPVVAEAVFQDHEEVPLTPIWRDPVHDFGFYRFDPKDLKFMKPVALDLVPEHARVGGEIRVVGNDAGEKISILGGTMARLDRDAPVYGSNSYNDFDTFYYQAASSTSGGSSGSPVLDIHGHVVALNAGASNRAATSFFLPLDRVVRALKLIEAGQHVSRGTIETTTTHETFDELRRLGLQESTEAAVRAALPSASGLLVVDDVLPGGPAYGKLEPGDVIVKVNGAYVDVFVPYEAALDDAVGGKIVLDVERGGQPMTVELPVGDLEAITPSAWLEMGGGVVHALSFEQARNHVVPVQSGLYVASSGYVLGNAGVGPGDVITSIDGRRVSSIDDLEGALEKLPDLGHATVGYFDLGEPAHQQIATLTMDRRWFPLRKCVRDDALGTWPCVDAPPAPTVAMPPAPAAQYPVADKGPATKLERSLVWVDTTIPYRLEGVAASRYSGTGVIVDAQHGLVLTDRNTVPIGLGDVTLTFAGTQRITAKVAYIDPVHDLAVVQYDPARLGGTEVEAVEFSDEPLGRGDATYHVGLTSRLEVAAQATKVRKVEPLYLPLTRPPTFRDANLEAIDVGDTAQAVGGVLADKKGRVQALWASFYLDSDNGGGSTFRGIPTDVVLDAIAPLARGEAPSLHILGAELYQMPISRAAERGLGPDDVAALEAHDPRAREVLVVYRLTAGTPAASLLREGDLLLAIDGKPVTKLREVEVAARSPQVTATVIRDGKRQDVSLPTYAVEDRSVDEFAIWAGAIVHATPFDASAQRAIPPDSVYVAWTWGGSPSARYGLHGTQRILAVDGKAVGTVDEFLAAVAGRPDRSAVRLKTVDLDGKVQVITLKLDLQYWPTQVFQKSADGWKRKDAAPATATAQ